MAKAKRNQIVVNISAAAKFMKAKGIEEYGWTNTLMDYLEEKYSLETRIRHAMNHEGNPQAQKTDTEVRKIISSMQKKTDSYSVRMDRQTSSDFLEAAHLSGKPRAAIWKLAIRKFVKELREKYPEKQ